MFRRPVVVSIPEVEMANEAPVRLPARVRVKVAARADSRGVTAL